MTNKEKFLLMLSTKIREYQTAYENSKNLPDDLFDILNGNGGNVQPKIDFQKVSQKLTSTSKKTGSNRRLVVKTIFKANKAIRKEDIIYRMQIDGVLVENLMQVATNALSALSAAGVIIKYKPDGATFRGNYWAHRDWFENGQLLKDHEPEPYYSSVKYELEKT